MTNWTIFKIIFFHFYLYSSVLSHNYSLHIKNPLYNVKKTLNIEKNLFSLYFWGAVFSKITNSNAQKWVIFRKKIFTAKLVLDILATFWGVYFLKCHWRPTLVYNPHWPYCAGHMLDGRRPCITQTGCRLVFTGLEAPCVQPPPAKCPDICRCFLRLPQASTCIYFQSTLIKSKVV